MSTILEMLANWFLNCAQSAVGAASFRGAYEAPVPEKLIENGKE